MEKLEAATLQGEAGFRVLFEYATISIIVIGREGRIELVNPCAQELFNYSSAELIGQPLEILIPEQHRPGHHHHREAYFHKPKARPMGYGMDLHARKKNGQVFPVEISLGHYELDGEPFAVAFVTDITKRKAAQQELKKANEELEQRVRERTTELEASLDREKIMNEMKSRFVSMASHEFRTPLSAVLSSVSLIEQYTQTAQEEKRKKHIERVKSSVRNMTAILNDFLSLDKLEQGKVEMERDLVSLREFAADLAEEVQGMLRKGQRISTQLEGEDEVEQDIRIMHNVLLNLLSNAIKYSPDDSVIGMRMQIIGDRVRISVADQGIGIPEEEQEHLFERFFRAKNSVNIQGTGLGLSIVKRYVELMNGEISFTSKAGEGTTFTVEFPRYGPDTDH